MDKLKKLTNQTNLIDSKLLTKIEILEDISNILIIKNLDTQENIEKLNEHLKEFKVKYNELKEEFQFFKNQSEENNRLIELLKTENTKIQNKLNKIYLLLKIFGFGLICSIILIILLIFVI